MINRHDSSRQPPLKLLLPKVRIAESAWKRLRAYVQACQVELGGVGSVVQAADSLTVTEVHLIDQEASACTFELDPGALGKFVDRWIRCGRDVAELKFWWHSHADTETFWSAIDEDTSRRMAGDGYVIALVANRQGEHRTCLTLTQPLAITVDEIKIEVVEELSTELMDSARAEVRQKVRSRSHWFRRTAGHQPADRSQFLDADPVEEPAGIFGSIGSLWRTK